MERRDRRRRWPPAPPTTHPPAAAPRSPPPSVSSRFPARVPPPPRGRRPAAHHPAIIVDPGSCGAWVPDSRAPGPRCAELELRQQGHLRASPTAVLPCADVWDLIDRPSQPRLHERMVHSSAESLGALKERAREELLAGDGAAALTRFQAQSSLLWQCITRARRLSPEQETTCRVAINSHARPQPPQHPPADERASPRSPPLKLEPGGNELEAPPEHRTEEVSRSRIRCAAANDARTGTVALTTGPAATPVVFQFGAHVLPPPLYASPLPSASVNFRQHRCCRGEE
nr:uncharacterized protein LOC127304000 [Lolium perenne]